MGHGRVARLAGGAENKWWFDASKAQRVVVQLGELVVWRAGSIVQGEVVNRVVMCWRTRIQPSGLGSVGCRVGVNLSV